MANANQPEAVFNDIISTPVDTVLSAWAKSIEKTDPVKLIAIALFPPLLIILLACRGLDKII